MQVLLKSFTFSLVLLVLGTGSAFAFPKGTTLPIPELVRTARFSLVKTKLSNDIQVVIFYYSASWCTPCKQTSAALRQAYPGMMKKTEGLEFITYTIDQSQFKQWKTYRELAVLNAEGLFRIQEFESF